jgi:hypothetical protein
MIFFRLPFAKKKYILNATKFWVMVAGILIFLALDITWLVERRKTLNFRAWHALTPIEFIISLLLLLAIVWFFAWLMFQVDKRLDAKMEEYLRNYEFAHKGDQGEEQVNQELQKILRPQDYRIFRNTVLPGRRSDIDFIVVGPKGVIVLEIKNYDTTTILTYDKAYYTNKAGQVEHLKKDYRSIVKWQAEKLEEYLVSQGFKVKVRKALVYLNPKSVDIRDGGKNNYGVYVAVGLTGLDRFIVDCYADAQFTPSYFTKICSCLLIK